MKRLTKQKLTVLYIVAVILAAIFTPTPELKYIWISLIGIIVLFITLPGMSIWAFRSEDTK